MDVPTRRVYTVDAGHSVIGFAARHMALAQTRGAFTGVTGTVTLPAAGTVPEQIEATAEAASLDTRHAARDAKLKGPDFLDVERYPQIVFRSTEIAGTGPTFTVQADLTIRGVTRPATFEARYLAAVTDPRGNERLGYEAHCTIDRRTFGITYNDLLGGGEAVVGDSVEIMLDIEVIRQP